jgi:1-acyl-sn-glycerol-3-phosphate acyltransferase
MLYFIIRLTAIILFKVLFRLQAFGRQYIPKKGGFILASNHVSYLDPPVLAAACPRVVHFLALEALFKISLFGRFIRALNAFPLRSASGSLRALRWAIEKLKNGRAVIIFPEGGRSPDARLAEPMRGVGLIAAKANVPIVPAFIAGSEKAMPMQTNRIYPRKIKVYFGKPILLREINVTEDSYQAIAEKVMQEIRVLKERGE